MTVSAATHIGPVRVCVGSGVEPVHSPEGLIGYSGGTCGGGVCSTGRCSIVGKVDAIETDSVPDGVAIV